MQVLATLRRYAAIVALLSAALAQAAPSPYIFIIRASKCPGLPTGRYRPLSGFQVQGTRGIYTALHGVVGCKELVAQVEGLTAPRVFASLEITQADIARDVALLSSEELEGLPADGLGRMTPANWSTLQQVQVIGHPHGVERQIPTSLQLREPPKVALENLAPPSPLRDLRRRASPRPDSTVVSIEGHLTRGHSGAPVLAGNDARVIAIANGGLAQGAIEVSWAIPFDDIDLRPVSAGAPELAPLARDEYDTLFAMDNEAPPQGSVRCFGKRLDAVRSVSLNDLLSTVDDPVTYQQAVFYYGLNGFSVAFTIFRDISADVSLAIPEGWTLQGSASRCTATPPSGAFELQYELFEPQGNISMEQLNLAVLRREYSLFCERNFVIDPSASNWVARPLIHRGIIARRKTYARIERRCGQPGLLPMVLQSPLWSSLPAPPPNPPGLWQCIPAACPPNPMFPVVPYPDAWAMMYGTNPPELISGWGFASFMASRTRNLTGTLSWDNAGYAQRLANCTSQLSNSAECQQAYGQQRSWAIGVIAAVASAVSSGE